MINSWATHTAATADGSLIGVPLVTVAELLDRTGPICGRVGPVLSRCMREPHDSPPCAALGTDGEGVAVVVVWYRPDAFPIPSGEPGE